jgi:uncharacterized phage protein (TIGR01671 family)
MQREIKFRCWDTLTNEMRYSGKHDGEFYINLKGVLYMYKIPNSDKYFKSYDVMEFTGLKDKNGKEYFFNDIVEFKDGSKGVLVWFDDRLGIASGQINNYHAIDEVSKQVLLESKIIGNIHENPELI